MLITSIYDEKLRIEKAWFNSSNVFYSEFIEDEFKNEGDLIVTFKNGATYKYKKVQLTPDYVMFKHGGLEGSHGKALNIHIKPKYEFEKMENKDIPTLEKECLMCITQKEIENKKKTYFISGHRDITESEFEIYQKTLKEIVERVPDALFVVGDYHGADIMVQNYLVDILEIDPTRITVYHMGDTPMNINPKIINTRGCYNTDEERDCAMTLNSYMDIAFVREHTEMSGTAQNILRRHSFNLNQE